MAVTGMPAGVNFGLQLAGGLANMGDPTKAMTTDLKIKQAQANESAYQEYLSNFGAYSKAVEGEYQFNANETLRRQMSSLSLMRARSAAVGNLATTQGGQLTSSGVAQGVEQDVYNQEQSLFQQGYNQVREQLGMEKKNAQRQLDIYGQTVNVLEKQKQAEEHPLGTFIQNIGLGMGKINPTTGPAQWLNEKVLNKPKKTIGA